MEIGFCFGSLVFIPKENVVTEIDVGFLLIFPLVFMHLMAMASEGRLPICHIDGRTWDRGVFRGLPA